ncbi:MAG TPA: hypothetical protein VGM94_04955 [Galbitalea sp.]|jgi:hypothetical protein
MSKTKVVLNHQAIGEHVMASAGMAARMAVIGEGVASKVPNGKIDLVVEAVRGGGSRVRARISNGTTQAEEARSNELTTALFSTIPTAKKTR